VKTVAPACLVLVILSGAAAAAQDRGAAPALPVRVHVRLRAARTISPRRIVEPLQAEVQRIWAPYGVQITWNDEADTAPARTPIDVWLIRDDTALDSGEWRAVLGRVLMSPEDREPRPIRVSFDATKSMLVNGAGIGRTTIARVIPDCVIARALGRVIAHEIGHVMIGAPYHDATGLMRANFKTDQLADPDNAPFRLTCNAVRKVRSGLGVANQEGAACD
jgi:hypothetical protein